MSKQQLVVIWAVGLLVSGFLSYVGIANPHVEAKKWELMTMVEWISRNADRFTGEAEVSSELERFRTTLTETMAKRFPKNYYLGGLAPVLILGTCTFLSTLRKKESLD